MQPMKLVLGICSYRRSAGISCSWRWCKASTSWRWWVWWGRSSGTRWYSCGVGTTSATVRMNMSL